MADDLSLLLKIRGDGTGGVKAVADNRAAIAQLRATATADFKAIESASKTSLGTVTQGLSQITSGIPVVGRALSSLSSGLGEVAETSTEAGLGMAALAGPAALAVVGIVALNTAAFKLHQALFGLAESAAEFRGKLFDLSQQTGVSVETLSALEILAKTTGSSIDQISASLGIFQKHLEDAQDPTSKQAALFEKLGIEVTNTEQTLRDTLTALAAMPTGFEQTAAALELFGRGGKSLLAILKETNGDLDGAIKRLRELGLVVSEEDARAADEFNDQLAILQFQLRALLGQEAIPAALASLKDLSLFLKDNKVAVDAVASALGTLASFLGSVFVVQVQQLGNFITAETAKYQFWADAIERVIDGLERLGAVSRIVPPSAAFEGLSGGVGGNTPFDGLTGSAAGVKPQRGSGGRGGKSDTDRELERQLALIKQLSKELGEAADRYQDVDTSTRLWAIEQEIANGALEEASAGLQQMARDMAANIDQVNKELKLKRELVDFQEKMNEAVRQALEGDKSYLAITQEFIDKQQEKGNNIDGTTRRWLMLQAQILATVDALEMYRDTVEAIQVPEGLIPAVAQSADEIAAAAGAAADMASGIPPVIAEVITLDEALIRLGETIGNVFGAGKDFAIGFADLVGGAIRDLAFGVGNLVENWVLLGSTGPAAMRKLVASVLAGVAAQAAVKAIYELAEGFAALFFNPAAAVAHFQAAALFGSIAGVTAIAGRAIAGDAFKPPERESRSGGSRSSGGGSSGSSSPATREVDRTRFQGATLTLRVPDGWLGDNLRRDFDLNGYSRLLIMEGK